MSECFEEQESAAAPVGAGVDDFSRETFDHRVDGFHLPTLSITTFVQMTFHLLSIAAHGFPGRRSAVLGGDQGLNPQFVAGQHVVGFAVEAGVRRDRLHSGASLRFDDERAEIAEVGPRSLASPGRQAEMTRRVADHAQLGVAAIGDGARSSVFSHLFSTPGIVATGVPRFEAAGVDGCQSHGAAEQLGLPCPLDRGRDQPLKRLLHQQPIGRLLQRREVGHLFQADRFAQRIAVRQQANGAPIGQVVKILEHQTGKQLMLREDPWAEPMRVPRQRSLGHGQCLDQHALRTLARLHPPSYEPTHTDV